MKTAYKSILIIACLIVTINARANPLENLRKSWNTQYTIHDKVIVIDRYWGGQSASRVQVSFWRAQGWTMELNGDCFSNCAFMAENLPTCVMDGAKLGYHMAYNTKTGEWIDNRRDYRFRLVLAVTYKGGFPKSASEVTVLEGEELEPFFNKCVS